MSTAHSAALQQLAIDPALKARRGGAGPIFATLGLVLILCAVAYLATRGTDARVVAEGKAAPAPTNAPAAEALPSDATLTVSGYVIPRERIEISPRFQGTVKWIGVKKGDVVKKDAVLVELESDEYRARVK